MWLSGLWRCLPFPVDAVTEPCRIMMPAQERHTGSQVNKRMVAEGDSRSGGVHKGDAVCRVTQGPVKQTRRLRHGELPNFTPQERLTLNLLPKMDTPAAAFRGPSWLVSGLV